MPGFVNYKKGALDSQSQVIKFTSCHDIAEILVKVALLNTKKSINNVWLLLTKMTPLLSGQISDIFRW
jgi:hypothetical protein